PGGGFGGLLVRPSAWRPSCSCSRAGVRVLGLEDDPKVRGLVLEEMRAERHPTIRWNFAWERYVVVGVPDGITRDLVYDFKPTRSRYLGGQLLPVAMAQADLYGLFFDRPGKRVQLYVVEEDATQTWDLPVDRNAGGAVGAGDAGGQEDGHGVTVGAG